MKPLKNPTLRPRRVSTRAATCLAVVHYIPGPHGKPTPVQCRKRRAARGLCAQHLEAEAAGALERKKAEAVNPIRRGLNRAVKAGHLPRHMKGNARVYLTRAAKQAEKSKPTV